MALPWLQVTWGSNLSDFWGQPGQEPATVTTSRCKWIRVPWNYSIEKWPGIQVWVHYENCYLLANNSAKTGLVLEPLKVLPVVPSISSYPICTRNDELYCITQSMLHFYWHVCNNHTTTRSADFLPAKTSLSTSNQQLIINRAFSPQIKSTITSFSQLTARSQSIWSKTDLHMACHAATYTQQFICTNFNVNMPKVH